MKLLNLILALLFLQAFCGCEEVIDLDLPTATPRLIVEASINWQKGTSGNEQTITLSKTTDYYETAIPKVGGATVYITNSSNVVFNFLENNEPGNYVCTNFIPQINETYILTIQHDGQTYTSTEKLLVCPAIKRVEQNNEGGLSGNEIEVKFFFDDIQNEINYYFLEIRDPYKSIPEYGIVEDRFFQDNEMFAVYSSEDLKPSDVLQFRIYGISKNYFNYMDILLEQTGTTSFGPFSTPTSTVRGNIVNQTDFNNFALGFFRLGETDGNVYTVQ